MVIGVVLVGTGKTQKRVRRRVGIPQASAQQHQAELLSEAVASRTGQVKRGVPSLQVQLSTGPGVATAAGTY